MNVSADGFEALDQMTTTSCDPRNCSACANLVKFKATPITEPQECPDSTLSVGVLDLAKNDTPAHTINIRAPVGANNQDQDHINEEH